MTTRASTADRLFWTGNKATGDNESDELAIREQSTESVKDISYKIHSAKDIFLLDSLFSTLYKLTASLAILGGSIVLKYVTVYWVIALLAVLPFCLGYLSHLITVLFEYGYTGHQRGKSSK